MKIPNDRKATFEAIQAELLALKDSPQKEAAFKRAKSLVATLGAIGISPRKVGLSLRQLGLNSRAV